MLSKGRAAVNRIGLGLILGGVLLTAPPAGAGKPIDRPGVLPPLLRNLRHPLSGSFVLSVRIPDPKSSRQPERDRQAHRTLRGHALQRFGDRGGRERK